MKITRLFDFAYYQLKTHNLDVALVSKKMAVGLKLQQKVIWTKQIALVEPYLS